MAHILQCSHYVLKLDLSLNHILDDSERKLYLDPARDLIWNIDEAKHLMKDGMRLILLGKDALALERRVQNPREHLRRYGSERRLQVYLVGTFPIRQKSEGVLERMIRFSIDARPSTSRILQDGFELERLRQKLAADDWGLSGNCLMAFGAPTDVPVTLGRGFWYKVPEVPDRTVDLRVYVPCFYDRVCDEVAVPSLSVWRMTGRSTRDLIISLVVSLATLGSRTYHMPYPSYLTNSGIQRIRSPLNGSFSMRFSSLSLSICIPY